VHCLKLHNRREDLIEIYAFNLQEALGNKLGFVATIAFLGMNPLVDNSVLARREVHKRSKDTTFSQSLEFVVVCALGTKPFLHLVMWKCKNIMESPFSDWFGG
jgi:hypothetical protein